MSFVLSWSCVPSFLCWLCHVPLMCGVGLGGASALSSASGEGGDHSTGPGRSRASSRHGRSSAGSGETGDLLDIISGDPDLFGEGSVDGEEEEVVDGDWDGKVCL